MLGALRKGSVMRHKIAVFVGHGESASAAAHDATGQAAAALVGAAQSVAISTQTVMVAPQEWVHVLTTVFAGGN